MTTAWTARLRGVPDWALREELARRGAEADTEAAVHLPGVTVDPVAGQLVWRGDAYLVGGRAMEVLYALALAHAAGRRQVRTDVLAGRVFRGWERDGALKSLRTTIHDLRRRFPGLLPHAVGGRGDYGFYRLATDAPTADRRTA